MTRRPITNIAASLRQRLLNKAREAGRPFNELLQYFAMERFLYRLSTSPHADKFVLKGALMFIPWKATLSRPTMDIDLLGRISNSVDTIVDVTKDVCVQDVEPDGIIFDAASIEGERIVEDADYEGVRVRFRGSLNTARITMQLDVGFGDIVVPSATLVYYPTILDLPAPRLHGYTKESVVAEKFETMVKLGILNSRMKDFYDIWLLSWQFDFDGQTLAAAIRKTFSNRRTEIHARPVALTSDFTGEFSKQEQWRGFIRKSRLENVPGELSEVIDALAGFLEPVANALIAEQPFERTWNAPGPWSARLYF